MLKETGIPTAEFDCDLASYVDVCCAMLDIPVYKNRVRWRTSEVSVMHYE